MLDKELEWECIKDHDKTLLQSCLQAMPFVQTNTPTIF